MNTIICKSPVAPDTKYTYTGEIITSTKYDPEDTVRMTCGIPDFPYRVIHKKYIVSIDSKPMVYARSNIVTHKVTGSKGIIYTVTNRNGNISCSCPGFQFRKHCKHIEQTHET